MNTDPIVDFLTRIRNASAAGLKIVEIPGSNVKRAMTEILFDQGFILNFKFEEDNKQGIIKNRFEIQRLNKSSCNYQDSKSFTSRFEKIFCFENYS